MTIKSVPPKKKLTALVFRCCRWLGSHHHRLRFWQRSVVYYEHTGQEIVIFQGSR
jgi:hypothetical protein